MQKSLKIVLLSSFIAFSVLFIIAYYYSPYLALYQIKEAIINNNKEKFNNLIDYTLLQNNLKNNINNQLDIVLPNLEGGKIIDNNLILVLNKFIKKTANQLIEKKINADKLLNLIKEQISINDSIKDIKMLHKSTNLKTVNKKYLLDYPDLNHFIFIINTDRKLNKQIKIYFERKGLLQWKIIDIKIE